MDRNQYLDLNLWALTQASGVCDKNNMVLHDFSKWESKWADQSENVPSGHAQTAKAQTRVCECQNN